MTNRKGSISVNTTDIFPIIKKWLYSEHDIFVRELVSNACDAITKRQTIARNQNEDAGNGKVTVAINKDKKTITFSDNGIGMSEAEVEKYIAQLAFSGAEEFVQKMKDSGSDSKNDIIGKFGLGFYSAFMVAEKVEINTLSMHKDSTPARWTCQGDTDYEFSASDKKEVGTSITLFVNEDGQAFLDSWKIRETLTRYCDFMPYTIELIDENEVERIEAENAKAAKEEDKKPLPVDIINETIPLWKKDPTSITEEEYKNFFRKMYPMEPEPLFWLHLNIDHPFTLQGILYFPKLNPTKPVNETNIRLYCKQVFVSDNVKNIIPDFLGLLKGAIDSTDIPLNVSRSALQGDPNIAKISNYIIKKVAESLKKLFKNDRAKYETIWSDIGLFVKYGSVSNNKFDTDMRPYTLFKNTSGKLVSLDEYLASVPEEFKDKLKNKVVYFEEGSSDAGLRTLLHKKGVDVLSMDTYIDPHFMQHAEMNKVGDNEVKFTLVDNAAESVLTDTASSEADEKIKHMFEDVLVDKTDEKAKDHFAIEVKNFADAGHSAYIKVDEQMKRFERMAKSMGPNSMSFPVKKTLVLNPNNPLVQNAYKLWDKKDRQDLAKKLVHHVQDLATISSQGLDENQKQDFVKRSQELVSELSSLAL